MQGERSGELVGPDVWETCRELIPAGSVFAFLAEHRDGLFPAVMFEDMYPSPNGRRVRLRYLGAARNDAWLHTRCAAINLRTLLRHGLTRRDGARALA